MAAVPRPEAAKPLLEVNGIEVIYNHVILVLKGVSLRVSCLLLSFPSRNHAA